MSHRDNYKLDVPSVTDLLKWAGYYDQYRDDPTGYYFKRGKFIEACGTILLQGQELDDRTLKLAHTPQPGHDEYWIDYINGLNKWRSQHQIKFIGAQIYVYNPWETYQGTLDWLLEIDNVLTVVDCKTGSCPKATALQTAAYDMALSNILDTFKPKVVEALRAWGIQRPRYRLGLQLEPGKCTEHWYHKDFRNNDDYRILVKNWWKHGPNSREYR